MSESDLVTKSTRPFERGKHAFVSDADPVLKEGRRTWLKYTDLGTEVATGGEVLAHVMARSDKSGTMPITGWHYHTCDHQFVYVTKGWLLLQMEDGTTVRVNERDSIYIPGGYKHNEIGVSDEYECLEVVIPGAIGTEPCETPEAWRDKEG